MSQEIINILDNQPNNNVIGCGSTNTKNIPKTIFTSLSRTQQIEQVELMLKCGVDIEDLQKELYLVCDKPTNQVLADFGLWFTLEEIHA